MRETGLFLVKPDGLLLGEDREAISRIKDGGLEITRQAPVTFTPDTVREFYTEKQDELSQYWVGYLIYRVSMALVVVGEDACQKLAEIKRAIRHEFQHDGFYTGTHSSDTAEDAEREMRIIFKS